MSGSQLFNNFGEYVFIAIAVYFIVKAVMAKTSGKLPAGEEKWVAGFTANGRAKYLKMSTVLDIISGVICIAISAAKILKVFNNGPFRIIVVAVCVLLLIAIIVVHRICKNTK